MPQEAIRKNSRGPGRGQGQPGAGLAESVEPVVEQVRELKADAIEYITEYTRQNPGNAALICLGVGFILGWKLKPW